MNRHHAAIAGLITLFCILLSIFMSLTLLDFLPPESTGFREFIYPSNLAGLLIGMLICPVFLPTPGKPKKPHISIIFLILMLLPNMIIHFFGFEFWYNNLPLRIFLAANSGMYYPMCLGLFFLTQSSFASNSNGKNDENSQNRLHPASASLCSFWHALALMGVAIINRFDNPLLEMSGLAADPFRAMAFLWNIIKWSMLIMGFGAIACILLLNRRISQTQEPDQNQTTAHSDAADKKAKAAIIFRLFGLTLVFGALRSFLETWLYPDTGGLQDTFTFYLSIIVPAVLLLALVAGKPDFLRRFLLPSIILFIFFPSLSLINEYPFIAAIVSTLTYIVYYIIWSVFPTLVVRQYNGSFWFYACSGIIYAALLLSFMGRLVNPLNITAGNVTLVSAAAAAFFMLLAFKLLFPADKEKTAPDTHQEPKTPHTPQSESYAAHKLTERQSEVAALILQGLENKVIAEKLLLSERTVKKYVGIILEKYQVKRRSEFIAKFLHE